MAECDTGLVPVAVKANKKALYTSVQAYIAHVHACASYQVCKGEFSVAVSQAVTSEVGSTQ